MFFALRNKLFLFSIIGFISLNILPIELWKIRNYNISGNKQFVGMETVHIYNYLAPRALAMNSNLNDDEAKKLIDERLLNYKKKNIFNDDEINKYKAKVGKDVLIENIPGFLKHYFLQFPRLFLSFPIEVPSIIYSKNDNKKIYNILKKPNSTILEKLNKVKNLFNNGFSFYLLYVIIIKIFYLINVAFSSIGLIFMNIAGRKTNNKIPILILSIIYFNNVALSCTWATGRLRVQILSIMTIFTSYLIYSFYLILLKDQNKILSMKNIAKHLFAK